MRVVPDSGQVLHGSQSWRARVPADRFTCAKLGFKADCGDGPIGTAVPARTLSYGFNAIPVVLISSQRPVSGEFQPSALVTAVTKLEWECAGCRCPVYSSWRQDLPGSEDGLATTLRCIELGRLRDRGSHRSVGLCRACSLASASVTSGYTPMANVLRFPAKR